MKIRFSKLVAGTLAATLVIAMSSVCAFADYSTTVVEYNLETANIGGNPGETIKFVGSTPATVTTTISGLTDYNGKYATYLISKTVDSALEIVGIDQKVIEDGTVEFTCTTTLAKLYDATATTTMDWGSNAAIDAADALDFDFGVNKKQDGAAAVTKVEGDKDTGFYATISGDVSEYGITVNGTEYPAFGCDENGVFYVKVEGLTGSETVASYAR